MTSYLTTKKIDFVLDQLPNSTIIINKDYNIYLINDVEYVERTFITKHTDIERFQFQNILYGYSRLLNALPNRHFDKISILRNTRYLHFYNLNHIRLMEKLI